jgi:beta-xylosidase
MKKLFVLLLAGTCFAKDPVTYRNPALAGDYPDPSVIRVGKDYWATATSSEWSPQFPIFHSKDLVNWEVVGSVFTHRPSWATGNFWAPEITIHNGRYYIYYVARKKGGPLAVAVATADKPQGPYTDHGPLVAQPAGSIDPVIFKDEKGDLYLIWKEDGNSRRLPCVIWAQKMDDQGLKLLGEPKELLRNDVSWEGAVIEGPFIVRRGDYFYMFYSGNGCCGMKCEYAMGVARAKSLLGPWEIGNVRAMAASSTTRTGATGCCITLTTRRVLFSPGARPFWTKSNSPRTAGR